MNDEIEVWVTKYALTSGIFRVNAKICSNVSSSMISYRESNARFDQYAHGNDWHKTEVEAIARAEQMRTKKIASLKKQIAKLEAMKFEPKG